MSDKLRNLKAWGNDVSNIGVSFDISTSIKPKIEDIDIRYIVSNPSTTTVDGYKQ